MGKEDNNVRHVVMVFNIVLFVHVWIFINTLDLETSLGWTPIKEYDQTVLFRSSSYITISLNMFSIGYLLKYNSNLEKSKEKLSL